MKLTEPSAWYTTLEEATQSCCTKAPGLQAIWVADVGEKEASGAAPMAADHGPAKEAGGASRSELHAQSAHVGVRAGAAMCDNQVRS